MAGTKAWMLRNDGVAFPVMQHLYVMGDKDLSSEADVASFIYKTNSSDIDYAKYVLECWMSLLVEDTLMWDSTKEETIQQIVDKVKSLPYHFLYPLSVSELINIHNEMCEYNNIDEYYEFIDSVHLNLDVISDTIKKSLNQQFCRVRYGGQYMSSTTNSELWFRISSTGYNWANVIYIFTSDHYKSLGVSSIYICRDYESDNGEDEDKPEYFYKAKDGVLYYNMPISEYLKEEHEHSPVFSSTNLNRGVLSTMFDRLSRGDTYLQIFAGMEQSGIKLNNDPWDYYLRKELSNCLDCSTFFDTASTRTQSKLSYVMRKILTKYPEITHVDIDAEPYPNNMGKMVGIKYLFTMNSDIKRLDNTVVDVAFTKGTATSDIIFRRFCQEYDQYKQFLDI